MGLVFVFICGLFVASCDTGEQRVLSAMRIAKFQNSVVTDKGAVRFSNVNSAMECTAYCTGNKACQSIFFTEKAGLCQANSVMYFEDADWTNSQGTVYYEMTNGVCPSWLGYRFSRASKLCYKFHVKKKMYRYEFQSFCQSEGGDLAVLDQKDKFDHIADIIRGSPMLSRMLDEGGFLVNILFRLKGHFGQDGATVIIDEVERFWPNGADVSAHSSVPSEAPFVQFQQPEKIGFVMSDVSSMMFNWTTEQSYALCEIATPDV